MERETFTYIYTLPAQLNAGVTVCVQDRLNAEKNNNLPHNALTVANQDTSCTLFLFLDNFTDATKPDYVLFPSQQITISADEGVTYSHLWIKNTHASSNVAANAIKARLSTVKEV